MTHRSVIALTLLLFAVGCATASPESPDPTPPLTDFLETPAPASEPTSGPADVAGRVAEARARLEGSEAGQLVLACIEAHGGLERWLSADAIGFHYAYRPEDGRSQRRTSQTVDLRRSRVIQHFDEPTRGVVAWDGQRAWSALEDADAVPVRFWALTPYYFAAMPFVLADPGVKLERSTDEPKAAGLKDADVVRVTFEPGTGDAPDDYYVLYIDKADHHLLGLRYVVSWRPFVEGKGIAHTPEKLVLYDQPIEVGGIRLYGRQRFFSFDGARGPVVTTATVSDVAFPTTFDPTGLTMPEGAVIDTSLDAR